MATLSRGERGAEAQSRERVAREAAEQLVSISLVQPILSQVRQDPFRSKLFHGGQGEEIFGAQLDQILAQRVTQSQRLGVVDSVYRQISRAGALPSAIPGAGAKVNVHG